MSKNEVAKKEVAASELAGYGDFAGYTGFEDVGSHEISIPFINVAQSNSEVVTEGKAKAGDLWNNVMEIAYPGTTGLKIIPCLRQEVFVEWVPIDDGGGFVGVHEKDSAFVLEHIKANGGSTRGLKCEGGKHDLVQTFQLFVLVVDDDGNTERAVIAFTSTKIPRYKSFLSKALAQQIFDPATKRKTQIPLFGHVYRVTTEPDQNKKGQKFHNISIAFEGGTPKDARMLPSDPLVAEAVAFAEMVQSGLAKADMSSQDTVDAKTDDEVPF